MTGLELTKERSYQTHPCLTSFDPMDYAWNSPGQNTGLDSLSLLQGIFPTQGLEPRSPALQTESLPAEPQGKPTPIVYILR